jgi:hypothetical protein
MRNNCIDDMIESCSERPYGSSVDKLIALFSATPNVSWIYILHNYDSGFVTHTQTSTQKERRSRALHQTNLMFCEGHKYSESIKNWPTSLKLDKTNDILVAFAWVHDEELRCAKMFPEFIGVDVTFGVNKEKRELLVAAGIDGHKKAFTAFRCFMPSKQQSAYTWCMNIAMPHLLTDNILQHTQCLTCDQELALNSAIITSIGSEKASFINAKLRLDMYHFYRKVWNDTVLLKKRNTTESCDCLRVIDKWISSWFTTIETNYENK